MYISLISFASFALSLACHASDEAKYIHQADELLRSAKWEEAVEKYSTAISINPLSSQPWNSRGSAYQMLQKYDLAIRDHSKAIELSKNFAIAYQNRGFAYARSKQYRKGIDDFDTAIKLDANDPGSYNRRAACYYYLQKYRDAISNYNKSLEISPKQHQEITNRGRAFEMIEEWEKAIQDYSSAINLHRDFADAYSERSRLLAECSDPTFRDPAKSLQDAKKACELTSYKNPHMLEILALSFAENKDFENAVKWQTKALEDKEYASIDGAKRLKFYKAKTAR